jgi:hypothetical protein
MRAIDRKRTQYSLSHFLLRVRVQQQGRERRKRLSSAVIVKLYESVIALCKERQKSQLFLVPARRMQ